MSLPEVADITSWQVGFLPIVREYARRMELVETIDGLLDCRMRIQPGKVVLAMIMDLLCGRTPLYRVHESFEKMVQFSRYLIEMRHLVTSEENW